MKGNLGRAGVIQTAHGDIQTPAFVTVGTKGTVKSLSPEMVKDLGAEVVLANTYHLYLQPGDEKVKEMGGLHKMMNWSGPTMTDSGGFQVFSLGAAFGKNITKMAKATMPEVLLEEITQTTRESGRGNIPEDFKPAKIAEDGVYFRSHIDGSAHFFSPEKSIEIQNNIGADIIFAFDECTSPNESFTYQRESLDRTHRWAKKCLEYHREQPISKQQAIFGIVQGGRHEELRKMSAQEISEMKYKGEGFDGFGIGGSFAKEDMSTAVSWVNEILPEEKPRHLLGIGEPEDLFMAVESGCDLFDCVAPTRIARNGQVYTRDGKINLRNAEYVNIHEPIDSECGCYTCRNYKKSYLAHLFRANEMFGATLASIHNLYFIVNLVKEMRKKMLKGKFEEFKNSFLERYKGL